MAAYSGTLIWRHTRLLLHLCDVWRLNRVETSGGPQDNTYSLYLSDVPYLLRRRSAIDAPELIGLLETEGLMTADTATLPPGVLLSSSWITFDRTLTATGAQGGNYNQGWIVKGDPVAIDTTDATRPVGCVKAYVTRLSLLPAEIITEYGL